MCVLALLRTAAAHGAPFNERIKSPEAGTTEELRPKLQTYFATFERVHAGKPGALGRDRAAYKQWFDLEASITRAMDEGIPLELSEFGLTARPDGTFAVDLKKYPQWGPLVSRLSALDSNPDVLETYAPELETRGFRDVDVAALGAYALPVGSSWHPGCWLSQDWRRRVMRSALLWRMGLTSTRWYTHSRRPRIQALRLQCGGSEVI